MTEHLILGDCLEVLPTIPDSSIDFILSDLPYGTTKNKWDTVIPLPEMWAEFWRVLKPNGCIALTAQTPFSEALGFSQLKYLRYKWLWIKSGVTGFLNSKKAPLKKTEDILIFYKIRPLYTPPPIYRG